MSESTPRWQTSPADMLAVALAFGALILGLQSIPWDFQIPWFYWQLLDRTALEAAPIESLWYLHGQPPVLNALLALLLAVSRWTGLAVEHLAQAAILGISLAGLIFLQELTRRVTGSRVLAFCAPGLVLLTPGMHVHYRAYFYPPLVATLVTGTLLAAQGYLQARCKVARGALLLGLWGLALTRSLFVPVFCLGLLVLVLWLRRRMRPQEAPEWKLVPLLALLLALWPLKNWWVFGHLTSTSWDGYNLTQMSGEHPEAYDLRLFLRNGRPLSPTQVAYTAEWEERLGRYVPVLMDPVKRDGSRNWNHVVLLQHRRVQTSHALRWRLENPGAFLKAALRNLVFWSRPTAYDAYSKRALQPVEGGKPASPVYDRVCRALESLWTLRVPGLVEGMVVDLSWLAEGKAAVAKRASSVPEAGTPLVVFAPLVFLAAVGVGLRNPGGSSSAVLVLAGVFALWVLAVPVATDGIESNRMRLAVQGLWPLLLLGAVGTLAPTSRSRRRHECTR